jgi:hypothetical protein
MFETIARQYRTWADGSELAPPAHEKSNVVEAVFLALGAAWVVTSALRSLTLLVALTLFIREAKRADLGWHDGGEGRNNSNGR